MCLDEVYDYVFMMPAIILECHITSHTILTPDEGDTNVITPDLLVTEWMS